MEMASLEDELRHRIQFYREQLAAYEAALEAEIAHQRDAARVKQLPVLVQTNGNGSTPQKRNGRITKIDFVYNLLVRNSKRGLTPAQIKRMTPPDILHSGDARAYPYVMLWKLKRGGDAYQHPGNGRYFPTDR